MLSSFQVKIGDFGLARDIYKNNYYRKNGGEVPIRWMAPECLTDGVYTAQSDAWAFGVVLWEVATLGQQPYPGRPDNMDVFNFVRAGGQLDVPPSAPSSLASVMRRCWSYEPDARPTFAEALQVVEEELAENKDVLCAIPASEEQQQHVSGRAATGGGRDGTGKAQMGESPSKDSLKQDVQTSSSYLPDGGNSQVRSRKKQYIRPLFPHLLQLFRLGHHCRPGE